MGHATGLIAGRRAEQLAFTFLTQQGLRPLVRNFYARGGEIDLVMLDQGVLVFIEVRFRRSSAFAKASHTVDRHKQQKIIRTAAMFNAKHPHHSSRTMRFDVVAIEGNGGPEIEWLQDAFRPNNSTL